MNGRRRSPSRHSKREKRLHRLLKPGALAQIRDFKINARFCHLRPNKSSDPNSIPSSPRGSTLTQQLSDDDFPCFPSRRLSGPRCPQRKKLVAVKLGLIGPASPSSPVTVSADDSILELFNGDMVAAG